MARAAKIKQHYYWELKSGLPNTCPRLPLAFAHLNPQISLSVHQKAPPRSSTFLDVPRRSSKSPRTRLPRSSTSLDVPRSLLELPSSKLDVPRRSSTSPRTPPSKLDVPRRSSTSPRTPSRQARSLLEHTSSSLMRVEGNGQNVWGHADK